MLTNGLVRSYAHAFRLSRTSHFHLAASLIHATRPTSSNSGPSDGRTIMNDVGRLESCRSMGNNYECGQTFLHRVFGYRGIILFPWFAKVHDVDVKKSKQAQPEDGLPSDEASIETVTISAETVTSSGRLINNNNKNGRSTEPSPHSYHNYVYQVLVDHRDWPFVTSRMDLVSVSELSSVEKLVTSSSSASSSSDLRMVAMHGSDFVPHEDILPYSSHEDVPVVHPILSKFVDHLPSNEPSLIAQENLRNWRKRMLPKLEMSAIYRETTDNIRVTVTPFYVGCRTGSHELEYIWRYVVRLENVGRETVQLRERFWRIISFTGTLNTVRGRGVVGKEPILSPTQRAFQYASHVTLTTPQGDMWGTFKMERSDGTIFDCRVPTFRLISQVGAT